MKTKKKLRTILCHPQNVDDDIDFPYGMRNQLILFIKRKAISKSYRTQVGLAYSSTFL